MTASMPASMTAPTADFANQPPPFEGVDLFAGDRALREAVTREGGDWARETLSDFGRRLGSAEVQDWGRLANFHKPEPRLYARTGERLDEVEFHPAYHALMALAVAHGLHSAPWAEPKPGAQVARAAGVILMVQAEAGVQCPITMTYGSVPTLRRAEGLARQWLPPLFSRDYDPRLAPVAEKKGVLIGMGMTEKQGGSDLRANVTRAEGGGVDGSYRIDGHKWFLSAPMCDGFLILAQTGNRPSCFLLPRVLPDGQRNGLRILRLKDKLGNRSNASSEVVFENATGFLIGEEGRGIPTIIEMGNHTRLDCALGSAGLMRAAVSQALHHARYRTVFQRRLVDQPLMTAVLADLALESEAATALALRLARAYERPQDVAEPEAEAALRRILTPAAKFWICKRGPALAAEAMEVLGGNGYIEDWPLARIYREAPVNSIWEGSGNIMCLDVMRALEKTRGGVEALLAELEPAQGGNDAYDRKLTRFKADLTGRGVHTGEERRIVATIAVLMQASLLLRHAPNAVGDAFCAARLGEESGVFGLLPAGCDTDALVARAMPEAPPAG